MKTHLQTYLNVINSELQYPPLVKKRLLRNSVRDFDKKTGIELEEKSRMVEEGVSVE